MVEDGKKDVELGEPLDEEGISIRQRILTEAARLFAHKGYAATSVREITQAAGATNPMVYYYFGSKAELYQAIITEDVEDFPVVMKQLMSGPAPFHERLLELLMFHFESVTARPDAARLFFRAFFGPDEEQDLLKHFRTMNDECEAIMANAIQEAQKSGELREGSWRHLELMISGIIMNPILKFLDHEHVTLDRTTAEALVEIFMAGAAKRVH